MRFITVSLSVHRAWWLNPAMYVVGAASWVVGQSPSASAIQWLARKAIKAEVQEVE